MRWGASSGWRSEAGSTRNKSATCTQQLQGTQQWVAPMIPSPFHLTLVPTIIGRQCALQNKKRYLPLLTQTTLSLTLTYNSPRVIHMFPAFYFAYTFSPFPPPKQKSTCLFILSVPELWIMVHLLLLRFHLCSTHIRTRTHTYTGSMVALCCQTHHLLFR